MEPPSEHAIASAGDRAGIASAAEGDAMELTAAEEPPDDDAMGVTSASTFPRGARIIPEAKLRREKHLTFVQSCTYADSMYKSISELKPPEKD